MNSPLLEILDLQTYFFSERGVAKAVDHVGFSVREAQFVGVVGESGCGKTVTALSVMRLIQDPPGRIVGGEIRFDGRNLLALSEDTMRSIRGNTISMIFQEPMTSLNPVFRVQDQISEVIQEHRKVSRKEALERTRDLLDQVRIPSPEIRMKDYPHQMSGGMRQRVMIAMAIACEPRLIIADEPTTALDVTIQAQILELLQDLRETRRCAVMLITHDLGVVAEVAEQVIVMYTGRVVEEAPVLELFENPLHPYTQGLLRSIPSSAAGRGKKRLDAVPGVVPSLLDLPPGCKFNTRCPHAFAPCFTDPEPELLHVPGGRTVRCRLYE
ncbi:MAG: ABC transporter ATP-binding protein [Syntrophobacteraceae bacterium]|nr:ABC transporter ATP-binding protein [Syntrophobacteraceae bacterium]